MPSLSCCVTLILLWPEWLFLSLCVCTVSMDIDLEGIIQCIKQGDETGVQTQLQGFNKEVTPHRSLHIFCVMMKLCCLWHLQTIIWSSSLSNSLPNASSLMQRRGSEGKWVYVAAAIKILSSLFFCKPFFFLPRLTPLLLLSHSSPPHLRHSLSVISKCAVSVVPDPLSLHAQADWAQAEWLVKPARCT